MNILIIEDEDLAVEKLSRMLSAIAPEVIIQGVASSITAAVQWLEVHHHPDLIFMDIELSDGQSFEIFNQTEVHSPVIFVTSYDEYAIKAFKVNSIDYLLKPIEEEDLKKALTKFHRMGDHLPQAENPALNVQSLVNELRHQLRVATHRDRFLVRQGQQWIAVETKDIAYFFAEGRLAYFFTWDKHKYIVDYTLEQLESMLDPLQFFRANRSYLIHIKSILQIHNYFNGKLKLLLKPGDKSAEVLVSKERAGAFKEWMGK